MGFILKLLKSGYRSNILSDPGKKVLVRIRIHSPVFSVLSFVSQSYNLSVSLVFVSQSCYLSVSLVIFHTVLSFFRQSYHFSVCLVIFQSVL